MKLLFVSSMCPDGRSTATIARYVAGAAASGHEVRLFGEPRADLPALPFTRDVSNVDLAVLVMDQADDLPDLPDLATFLEGVPRERRVIIDCQGRYNDTIHAPFDCNHHEKLDGHTPAEWRENMAALARRILQPTLRPRRSEVASFLFHGLDPALVIRPFQSADEAARAWSESPRSLGIQYAGSNWRCWPLIRSFLESAAPALPEVGPFRLVGRGWERTPTRAVEAGDSSCKLDYEVLSRLEVRLHPPVRYDEVAPLLSRGRFVLVVQRPVFTALGLLSGRLFEAFHADALPLLLLPRPWVAELLGEQALTLVPGEDVAGHLRDALRRPARYWRAVLETRRRLADHHSIGGRLAELIRFARE